MLIKDLDIFECSGCTFQYTLNYALHYQGMCSFVFIFINDIHKI